MNDSIPFHKKIAFRLGAPMAVFIVGMIGIVLMLVYHAHVHEIEQSSHAPTSTLSSDAPHRALPQETQEHVRIILVLGLTLILFTVYEFRIFTRHIRHPLAAFGAAIRAIREGDYTARIATETENEFTPLAVAINSVAETLERQKSNNIENMERIITDLNKSTKMLIQRDLELTRANEQLRQLDTMKSEFVSLVTHQLRTPLSGARWALSMLINGEMGELTPEQKLYLMKTYESNNRMISLINDMLQADRVDSGTAQFSFEPTNILTLLENVLLELRQLGEKRDIRITLSAPESLPAIMIDPTHMRIVLQNLIDNAVKYSKPKGEVRVAVVKQDENIEITIEDDGIGIPKEHQKNIFKRFFRAPNALHMETDGTGLGLYLVENIVRKHHGTIRFVSEENTGTTFAITLPIQKT